MPAIQLPSCHKIVSALIPTLVIWLVALCTAPVATSQRPEPLTVQVEVSPHEGVLGETEFTGVITLTGSRSQCGSDIAQRPSDIIFVIDHSQSMFEPVDTDPTTTRAGMLQRATRALLGALDPEEDLVGVVEFDITSNVAHPLSGDWESVQAAVDAIEPGNGTSLAQGIIMAEREFSTERARKDASHTMILITDGGQQESGFGPTPLEAAEDARMQGVRIIVVALGTDLDQDSLRALASQPSDFYHAPEPVDLESVLLSDIPTLRQPPAATAISIEHTYDPKSVEIIPDSPHPSGVISENAITWAIAEVRDSSFTLSYRVRPLVAGSYTLDQGTVIRYRSCGADQQEVMLPPALSVEVATQSTSRTQPPSELLPSAICILSDLPIWSYCLGFMLLLFFIWWSWRLLRELRRLGHERQVDRVVIWLLVPIGLVLLSSALFSFSGDLCRMKGRVSFSRIDSGESDGWIYVADMRQSRPTRTFKVAEGQPHCIGCHSVSPDNHRLAAVANGVVGPVVVYDLRGKPLDIPDVQGSYVEWSPDGMKLAVSTDGGDIVIIDLTEKTVTKLKGASESDVAEAMPAWSADGEWIAFVRGSPSGFPWAFQEPCDIYVVSASGGIAVPLDGASGEGFNYYPAYSPDGRWLAFTRHISGTTTYAAREAEVFLVPAGGGDRIRLAANDLHDGISPEIVSNSWPAWSHTGEWLAFASNRDDEAYDVFITHVSTSGNSGPAVPLRGAANFQVFEHLPYWGELPQTDPWIDMWGVKLSLVVAPLLLLLWWWLRRRRRILKDLFEREAD